MEMEYFLMDIAAFLQSRPFFVVLFVCLVFPAMTLWWIEEWFSILSREQRIKLQGAKNSLLTALIPHGFIHVFYTWQFDTNTFEWKIHLIAALYDLLFVLMVIFNFEESLDVKRAIGITYIGASFSFVSLATEVKHKEKLDAVASFVYKMGIVLYFIGLFSIVSAYREDQRKAKQLRRIVSPQRQNTRTTRSAT